MGRLEKGAILYAIGAQVKIVAPYREARFKFRRAREAPAPAAPSGTGCRVRLRTCPEQVLSV